MPDVIQIAIQATDEASKVIGGVGAALDKLGAQAETAEKKVKLFGLSTEQIGAKMSAVGKIATVGLTLPLAGLATVAIKSASDLNETMSKIDVLFENSADTIKDWASTAATSLGQSKQQALDAAADFATFGRAAGLAGNDLVEFSEQNVKLAADFASFFNTSPEEAITAIGAAFRGESEPIRRYGVLINEAALKDEALRLGLIKTTTEALQPQQRVLAAQALIMKQTTAAQGDFARTSEGLANQQRILSAQFQDTVAALGQSLLPTVIKVASAANDLLTAFNNLDQPTKDLIVGFGLMAAAAGPVLTVGGKLIGVFTALGSISIDAGGKLLSVGKTIGETAGYLKQAGVSVETLKFAFQNLKGAGVILGAELGIIIAGLIVIAKYLEETGNAARATTDDLLKMANSGDVFKQAAASTEILTHGQDRLADAVIGTSDKIKSSAKDYADYKSSIEAVVKAAGLLIDSEGNLYKIVYDGIIPRKEIIRTNYELSESGYKADQVSRTQAYGIDLLSNSMLGASQAAAGAKQSLDTAFTGTDSQIAKLRELTDANWANTEAGRAVYQALSEQSAAQQAAIAAEETHRASIAESITAVDKLAQSLKDATNAQAIQTLAQGQLDVLKKAYEEGKINAEGFQKATDAVLLRYDLATPKSLAMAEAQGKINEAFLNGQLPLEKFIAATDKIPGIANDGKVTLQELANIGIRPTTTAVGQQERAVMDLKNAWDKIPANVTTTYSVVTKGEAPESAKIPAVPGKGLQYGGVFTVPPNPRGGTGDYFPVLAAPGERVTVQTKAQQGEARGSSAAGSATYIYNTNVYNPLAAAMLADKQRRDRLARSNSRMGVM